MALDSKSFQPLDIKLSGPHDDEEDIFFKDLLLSLVGGEITPNEAANNLDKWIVEKSNTDLEERKKYPDPWNVPSPENPSWVAPNPSGLITCFFESFARLCSAFPPGHVGQDRLIRFLEALRDMPKHEVPNYLPNDPPEDFYYLLELWPFGGSWLGLTEVFPVEKVSTSDSRAMWSLERWGQWKDRLETIASDDTFAPEVREVAGLAVDRMGELEVSDGSS
ncbi:unnamed protein product [Aspergillus oryzae]|nr:unnamed protein product [Aspergillus oryzae]GMF94867.1 unnamed protein product [Aspergillus oryzae]